MPLHPSPSLSSKMAANNCSRFALLFLVSMGFSFLSSSAYKFYVGGRDGWVLHPSESYDEWAGRNRFQVNDTLVFRYKKGEDSVLVVSKEDYDACNASNPIEKLDDGNSEFKFGRSGPFFFVSGVPGNCKQGQKLVVVVLAARKKSPAVPPAFPPTGVPGTTPEAGSPPVTSPPSPSSSSMLSVPRASIALVLVSLLSSLVN